MEKMTGWLRETLHLLTLSQAQLEEWVDERLNANPWLEVSLPATGDGEDIVVSETSSGFTARLGAGVIARVRPSIGPVRSEGTSEKLREAARRLARALEWRGKVLLSVAQAVVDEQVDFLSRRCDLPRRLQLRELARRLSLHETTVGRATQNKMVLTPRGRFSLRFLVNDRTNAEVITEALRAIIVAEDPKAPLSDAEIARRLSEDGLTIARRTVAKYREAIGLPEGRSRRK